jgi:hypothetical protein
MPAPTQAILEPPHHFSVARSDAIRPAGHRARVEARFKPNLNRPCTRLLEQHVEQQIGDPRNLLTRTDA